MAHSLTRIFVALLSVSLLLCLSSCDRQVATDPVDAIPADVTQVTVFNLGEITAANGSAAPAGDDGLLPEAEQALGMFLPSDMLRPMAAVLSDGGNGVDTSNAVMFTAPNGYTGIILKVTDRESLVQTLLPYRDESADFGDYKSYTTGKRLIAFSDELCVITPDVATAKTIGQKKGNRMISDMTGVKKFLSSDNAVRSVRLASDIFGKKMDGLWLCASLRFSDSALTADISAIHPDGTPDSIGARIAGKIDSGVLGFVPNGCSLVIASGVQNDDTKLFGIEDLVKNYFPGDIVMSGTGTSVWYARPAGTVTDDNLFSPEVWNFTGIIQMPQTDGEMAVSNMRQMTRGIARLDSSTGCYTITRGDFSISYGYIDGCFVQSANGPVTNGNSNPFTMDFHGARLAAVIDIPGGSSLRTAIGLPCGASFTVKVTTENIHAKLAFYGNPRPLLSTVGSVPPLKNILPFIAGVK